MRSRASATASTVDGRRVEEKGGRGVPSRRLSTAASGWPGRCCAGTRLAQVSGSACTRSIVPDWKGPRPPTSSSGGWLGTSRPAGKGCTTSSTSSARCCTSVSVPTTPSPRSSAGGSQTRPARGSTDPLALTRRNGTTDPARPDRQLLGLQRTDPPTTGKPSRPRAWLASWRPCSSAVGVSAIVLWSAWQTALEMEEAPKPVEGDRHQRVSHQPRLVALARLRRDRTSPSGHRGLMRNSSTSMWCHGRHQSCRGVGRL